MKPEAKKKLLASRQIAAAQAAAILAKRDEGTLTAQEVREHFYAYVLAKYMLEDDEAESRNLTSLAGQSLAKIIKIDKALLGNADKSPTCDGASSVDMKLALLIAATQREFGVKLNGIEAAFAETSDELADLVWGQLK